MNTKGQDRFRGLAESRCGPMLAGFLMGPCQTGELFMRRLKTLASLLVLGWATSADAQVVQFDQQAILNATNYQRGVNYRSFRGVPLSNVSGNGSDGRAPLTPPATTNQFRGFVSYGAVVRPRTPANLNVSSPGTTNYTQNAGNIGLPRGTNSSGQILMVLRSAQVGAPYLSRPVAFLFGSFITPPATDEDGRPLIDKTPAEYWVAEPYTTNAHAGAPYYWSPHAGAVFAIQSGPIQVRWKKAQPGSLSSTNGLPAGSYVVESGFAYRLTNSTYIVSGSAFKTPRKIYWTEGIFRPTGKPVAVPTARISTVSIVYNSSFPRTVLSEYVAPGQSSPTDGTTNAVLPELRTLWYDSEQAQILAYNREGRVFLELLGDSLGGGVRRHLGYEIVDVYQQVTPADVTIELGDRITAYDDGKDDTELNAEPVQAGVTQPFLYSHAPGTGLRTEYYAARETVNLNDVLVHWLEPGVAGLRWPVVYNRYKLIWPTDIARYSHYVRPWVATETEARQTAVPLPTENVPTLQYQDPLDQPRGKLTESFAYYSFLNPEYPVHRALLLFTAGERVAFERVFSWLDVNLKATNFSSTLATNLTAVNNYHAFQNADRTSGANGTWRLFVTDDSGSDSGQIGSWAIQVVTTNSATGTQSTQEFTSSTGLTIPSSGNASPYPSTVTVSNLTQTVLKVRVKINGLTHTYPSDIDMFLMAPSGSVCALMSDVGGSFGITNVNLIFDDAAVELTGNGITSGTYRPTNNDAPVESLPPGATGTGFVATLDELLIDAKKTPPAFWPAGSIAPIVVNEPANVGDRINAPAGEQGSTGSYLAGYINQAQGNSFHRTAYRDPFVSGFEAANRGAIIPVNAIPGRSNLDVWWFRRNATNAVQNEVNGFKPVYWPAVIGRYTLQYPASPAEIVLASNDGSGALESLPAKGTVYSQPDPTLPGYNPNEEHGVMIGGQAYALRDDLNLTSGTVPAVLAGVGATFSSQPFVLLDYTESDGRPAMKAFKVLREKPSEGILFDYVVTAGGNASRSGAGSILQAPMPLPLLPPPVELVTNVSAGVTTITRVNYNREPADTGGDLPVGWTSDQANGPLGHYARFTFKDRKENFWVMRGLHAGLPSLQAGSYSTNTRTFSTNLPVATAVAGQPFTNHFHVSRPPDSLVVALSAGTLPAGLAINGVALTGTPTAPGTNALTFTVTDNGEGISVTNTLTVRVISSGSVTQQGPLTIVSTNKYALNNGVFVGRAPFLAAPADGSNSFTMRFYYKTQKDFDWPGLANPPAVGSVVPYLRPLGTNGQYLGDGAAKSTPSLDVVYRPVWPSDPPTMAYGQTLMDPQNGLPAVRGQTSVQVLYQQSIGRNITNARPSVVLHDPTSEKSFALKVNAADGLSQIPGGVKSEVYQGKTYFPNLPPHLAQRLFWDPTRGTKGSLVFKGEFKDEVLGADYLMLNVLRGSDLAAVKALCPDADALKAKWDAAVDGLAATVVTKYENPQVPGQFINNPALTRTVGIGDLIEIADDQTAVDSYALSASGPGQGYVTLMVGGSGNPDQTPSGEPVTVYVMRVMPTLYTGELTILPSANPLSELVSFQHKPDLAGRYSEYEYEWKIAPPVDGFPPATDSTMSRYQPLTGGLGIPLYTLGGSGIQALVDNYIVLRYRSANTNHPLYGQWSEWTAPALAEGWIKRVLAGINPFNQRVTDLYNNTVNTDANILTSAGKRWEGDIALNLANINNYGLIEIYETVLKRGRGLSIDSGINFGPANDALLLAAGYINDLYMLVGNEAYADAANPTIGIGTKDNTYGDIATALFAFKGQVPTLLDEELALLRGRDDVSQPGVGVSPVYNRLIWNYTRGIDSGEVIYALNYNILDQNTDGKVDAADAAKLFPQGHGDAYGHYLTALKGYYSLLMNANFDWVPRIEAVNILGKPVTVDYLDERKFAAAAAAVGRTGRQVFDLTWRKDYLPGQSLGWERFSTNRVSTRQMVNGTTTNNIVRHWGADQWASRSAQGTFFNWVVGNAILPDVDPDPSHEGIQRIDRTTVPELRELATMAEELQTAMDNAEGRLTPLGISEGSLAFDINPNTVVGANAQTHFEQIYDRAKRALNNAVVSFDDAKDVTRLMRSEQDSLADYQTVVTRQELAYTNALIELYGTPYADDIGTGKTYRQGYEGPDLSHFVYVDDVEIKVAGLYEPASNMVFRIDKMNLPPSQILGEERIFDFPQPEGIALVSDLTSFVKNKATELLSQFSMQDGGSLTSGVALSRRYVDYQLNSHGYFQKPATFTGRRRSAGKIQASIGRVILAHNDLNQALAEYSKQNYKLDSQLKSFDDFVTTHLSGRVETAASIAEENTLNAIKLAYAAFKEAQEGVEEAAKDTSETVKEALPRSLIVGIASGGDLTSAARGALNAALGIAKAAIKTVVRYKGVLTALRESEQAAQARWSEFASEGDLLDNQARNRALELDYLFNDAQLQLFKINDRLRKLVLEQEQLDSLIAQGDRIQAEREVFRQRAAAVIQGYRTRDAAFRIFRNEKLERYKTLFDLASRYSLLAANAYDYETGLLHTDEGRSFVNRIVNSRALGVIRNGEPQFAGSNTGDPGLSSALAEMKADWDVLKGRLGFNNPDSYGTTVSLRGENFRILSDATGDLTWKQLLQASRMDDLLQDEDVRRHCLQIDPGTGLPRPGIVITFSTTIAPGLNLFGRPLAAGDSAYSQSSFATKIYATGVALVGYRGMNNPVANGTAVSYAGGTSPSEPSSSYLDPRALAATPYVYLIPAGVDSMRSPPLGDAGNVRSWSVNDVAIPLPFNIGASEFSTKSLYQSSDSLTENLFAIRKHQSFRPVSTTTAFSPDVYGVNGTLQPSQFTNRRLIGRSVWNSKWKLVIPGDTLLNDPKEGLIRFIQTVSDIKLYFITYSYSGN